MKVPITQPTNSSKPMLLMFLTIMLTISLSTQAIADVYTYTSHPFNQSFGSSFPLEPAIGDTLKIEFTFDGDLSTGINNLPFTMTAGLLTLSSSSPNYISNFELFSVDSTGLPTSWHIQISTDAVFPGYAMNSQQGGGLTQIDGVWYAFTSNWIDQAGVYVAGPPPIDGWSRTSVPEPATMLLIGSGLLGLAGYGRKKLFKK